MVSTILIYSILSSLTEVRTIYKNAITDSDYADKLVTLTSPSKSTAVYRAYYATGLALQAKHSWNPSTKLSKCSSASVEFNTAVNSEINNLEIRFLRFSFESNAPAFLGYSTHLTNDKSYILNHLDKAHPMWPTMRDFLKNCDQLSAAEKKKIQ